MIRTQSTTAFAASLLFVASSLAQAQQPAAPAQSQSVLVPQRAAAQPGQQAAPADQPVRAEKPLRPQTAPVTTATQPQSQVPQSVPAQPVATIGPELLYGAWDVDVDSYLETQLAMKGKSEHPAKVELARNLLKSNGMNIRIAFEADGTIGVDKTYCGECESKKGTWCVECIDGQEMSILVKGHHGWTRKDLELEICDDLHIRVRAPKEIAGVYARVPDSVTPVGDESFPPPPPPIGEPTGKDAPKPLKATKGVPKRVLPAAKQAEKPNLGESSDEIAP